MSDQGDGFDVRTLAATFHAGTTLAPHRHSWGQLVFAASGVMQVVTDDAAWLIPTTRAIWLPAGVRHRIAARSEIAMRTLYIDGTRAAALSAEPRVLEVAPLLRELILHILCVGMLTPARPDHDRLAGLLIDLLAQAHREDLMLPLPHDPRARKFAEHMLRNPGDGRDMSLLATEVGASLRTLQRLFPRQTGLTMEAWRQKARLIHAVACLSAGASVASTALDCGYRSFASFSAAFTRQFGASPRRYAQSGS